MDIKMTIVAAMLLINFISASVIAFSGSECDSDLLSPSYYKPHPIYCEFFYQCSSNATYVLHSCPPDLHFNPILNVCDYPDLARCLNYNGNTSAPGPSETTTMPVEETTTDVTTDLTQTDSTSDLATDITTDLATDITTNLVTDSTSDLTTDLETDITTNTSPSDKCTNGEYLAHEHDCEAFYRCIAETFIMIYCPSGMQFNITLKGCELQGQDCKDDEQSTISQDIPSSETTPEVSSEYTIEVTSEITFEATEICANNEFKPDLSDCEAFYRCFNGQFYLLKCPSGMHFNENTKQCETPETAGCAEDELTTETKCSNGEYRPHPTDCEAVYRCMNGSFVILYCPDGMHFNINTRGCDSPQTAGCSE